MLPWGKRSFFFLSFFFFPVNTGDGTRGFWPKPYYFFETESHVPQAGLHRPSAEATGTYQSAFFVVVALLRQSLPYLVLAWPWTHSPPACLVSVRMTGVYHFAWPESIFRFVIVVVVILFCCIFKIFVIGSHYVFLTGLELTKIHVPLLPSAGIKKTCATKPGPRELSLQKYLF